MSAKWLHAVGRSLVLTALLLSCNPPEESTEVPPSDLDVKSAIEAYVRQDIDLRGAFYIRDPRDDSVRRLSYDYVHETVHATETGAYACVDFKDAEGNSYDVDIHMARASGVFKPAQLVFHKVNGEVVSGE